MSYRKADDKLKDNRRRRMISAYFDLSREDEKAVCDFNDRVRNNKELNRDGAAWKDVMKNAILLYHAVVNQKIDDVAKIIPALADAMNLYKSLKRGDVSILKVLFPEAYELFRTQLEADIIERYRDETRAHVIENIYQVQDKLKQLDDLKRSIERLQLSGQSPQPVGLKPVMASGDGSIRQIQPQTSNVPQFEVPEYDDDEDLFTVKKDEDAGRRVAENLLGSLDTIQSYKGKKDPIIEARMKAKMNKSSGDD